MKRVWLVIISLIVIAGYTVPANAEVGYDGGFYISSDDDMFKLRFNSLIQPRLFYERSKSKPLPNDPTDVTDQISFSMRRVKLGVKSWVGEKISFGFGIYHSTTDPYATNGQFLRITGATATYAIMPQLGITVGMVGLPLDFMSEASSSWLLLTEAPAAVTRDDGVQAVTVTRPSFGVPDGLGINFAGDISKFFYSLSVVNGAESNYALNPDRKMSAGVRLGVNIMDPIGGSMTDFDCSSKPKLTVSVGTMYQGKRNDDNTNGVIKYLWTSSVGGGVRWAGFSFTAEGYYRRMKMDTLPTDSPTTPRSSYTDIGYWAGIGYYVMPKKLEIAGQVSQIIRQGPDNNVNQFGGGINWYIHNNNLKAQISYTLTQDYDDVWGDDKDNIHNVTLSLMANF